MQIIIHVNFDAKNRVDTLLTALTAAVETESTATDKDPGLIYLPVRRACNPISSSVASFKRK